MIGLNVGCGYKFHEDWVNADMAPASRGVMKVDLFRGIPFSDDYFDVVYHSQVLEHFPKEKAQLFLGECYRVLKPGGVLRVVVPDLENIVGEYKRLLDESLKDPNEMSDANYDWIMLEMLDQMVRNFPGGGTADFLRQPIMVNEKYVMERIGLSGQFIRNNLMGESIIGNIKKAFSSIGMFKRALGRVLPRTKASRVGAYRLGGEVHMWLYDRYSLSRLLKGCGFVDVVRMNPFESGIPDWGRYQLDVKGGIAYDPTSLFMESRKA